MFRHYLTATLLVLSALSTPLFAQAEYEDLAQRLADYGRLTQEMQVDSFLDFIDPELYEIVPREMMAATFRQLLEDENMDVSFSNFTVKDIGESVTVDSVEYLPIRYRMGMKFVMPEGGEYYDRDVFDLMSGALGANYGEGEVAVDTTARTIQIDAAKTLFAIRRGPAAEWYFLEYNKDNIALLDMLVPPTIREQLRLE